MGLTENDDMIQALAADRPDQPFGFFMTLTQTRSLRSIRTIGGMGCTSDHAGISLGWGSRLHDPRPRSHLWRINARSPASICGRPPKGRDFQRNNSESQSGASG
jgi:hypothetical protein